MAQSQAAAANDASAAADAAAAPAADASDEKTKTAGDGDSDAVAGALSLVSQSLAAAIGQPGNPMVASGPGKSSQDAGASAISLTNGSSTQDVMAMLTKDTADGAKSSDDADADAAALTTAGSTQSPAADSTGATAIQTAHLSAGSHFAIQHPTATTDKTTGDVRASVGSAAFNDELGGKLTWMAHQGVDSASLKLSPEHLGPLEVRISVQNGAASVWFGANHADTRAALEQALPHLRQMFANQGLTLTDSGVSRESPRGQGQKPATGAIASLSGVGGDEQSSVASVSSMRSGLLDTYA